MLSFLAGYPKILRSLRILAILALLLTLTALVLTPPVWQLKRGPLRIVPSKNLSKSLVNILGPGERGWLEQRKVSHHVIHAIIVAEDARFYEHYGLDLREIRRSISFNWEKKRYARGASTISQQVVKLAFLNSEKTMLRKLREAIGTLIMEQILSKEEILDWYINLVDFGDGVTGIRRAAHVFFQTKPELLTIQQAAYLAMVLPSPNRRGKALTRQALGPHGHRRYLFIINEMHKQGYITEALRDSAIQTGDFGRPVNIDSHSETELKSSLDDQDALPSGRLH